MSVSLVVGVVVGIVLGLTVLLAVLKIRKVRQRSRLEIPSSTESRLVTPPPSPYATSKGFRLLDGSNEPRPRPEVARPRLDREREYVFGDAFVESDDVVFTSRRHSDDWFLSRYSHRSTLSSKLRRFVLILLILVVVVVTAMYYFTRPSSKSPTGSAPFSLSAPVANTTSDPVTTSPQGGRVVNGNQATTLTWGYPFSTPPKVTTSRFP